MKPHTRIAVLGENFFGNCTKTNPKKKFITEEEEKYSNYYKPALPNSLGDVFTDVDIASLQQISLSQHLGRTSKNQYCCKKDFLSKPLLDL